jgi:hypothetical protein
MLFHPRYAPLREDRYVAFTMSTRPNYEVDTDLIHFDGVFTTADKDLLCHIVAQIERTLSLAPVPEEAGCPWVMVAMRLASQETYYLAHRMGYPIFLKARSAEDMVHQLRCTWVPSVKAARADIA